MTPQEKEYVFENYGRISNNEIINYLGISLNQMDTFIHRFDFSKKSDRDKFKMYSFEREVEHIDFKFTMPTAYDLSPVESREETINGKTTLVIQSRINY